MFVTSLTSSCDITVWRGYFIILSTYFLQFQLFFPPFYFALFVSVCYCSSWYSCFTLTQLKILFLKVFVFTTHKLNSTQHFCNLYLGTLWVFGMVIKVLQHLRSHTHFKATQETMGCSYSLHVLITVIFTIHRLLVNWSQSAEKVNQHIQVKMGELPRSSLECCLKSLTHFQFVCVTLWQSCLVCGKRFHPVCPQKQQSIQTLSTCAPQEDVNTPWNYWLVDWETSRSSINADRVKMCKSI